MWEEMMSGDGIGVVKGPVVLMELKVKGRNEVENLSRRIARKLGPVLSAEFGAHFRRHHPFMLSRVL
jgi:hypothetical protein